MRILVVEDDPLTASALMSVFVDQHHAVEVAGDGQSAGELVAAFPYDLIVLDVMLPRLDGIGLCRQLRSQGYTTPILLLSGRNTPQDKALGLDAGADDYLVKPFDLEELVARVRVLLRRGTAAAPILKWGDLHLDPSACEVTYGGKLLRLTPKEYALLELFLRNNRRVFSCGAILEHLWTYEDMPGEEAVRTQMKGLRQKLKGAGAPADWIETVYGIGYRLKPLSSPPIPRSESQMETLTAIAGVWQQFQERVQEQVAVLDRAAAALQQSRCPAELHQQAQQEAHTLAGSLGTFGIGTGSQLARQIEVLLQSQQSLTALQVQELREWVVLLQQQITQGPPAAMIEAAARQPLLLLVNCDFGFAQLLVQAASSWGVRIEFAPHLFEAKAQIARDRPQAILIDRSVGEADQALLSWVAELAKQSPAFPILVFSTPSSSEAALRERLLVAQAGGRTLDKSLSPPQILEAVVRSLQPPNPTSARILIVDDDPQLLAGLRQILEPWGMQVTTLDDPRRFWDWLAAAAPDLLILDIEMPHLSGIELCQAVRADLTWSGLPVLFLTAHTDPDTIYQVFSVGADDFVSKPIAGPELVSRILNRLERSRLQRRLTALVQTSPAIHKPD